MYNLYLVTVSKAGKAARMDFNDDVQTHSDVNVQAEDVSVSSNDVLTDLTTRPLSRRSVLSKGIAAGLGVTTLGTFLAACGGSSSTASSGPVTIQFAALTDTTGEQTNEINKFNQLNAGKIKVEYVQLPPVATDQYSKFVTGFRAQAQTPDVVHIDVTWPAQFATPGWLAPIDSYVNSTYLNQFWPSAQSVGKINGKLYGIQRYMDIGMLYYRTDLVQKYGGTVPQTRSDMETMAMEMLAKESSLKYGYLMPGKKSRRLWMSGWNSSGEPVVTLEAQVVFKLVAQRL